jgi:hypothetical protein
VAWSRSAGHAVHADRRLPWVPELPERNNRNVDSKSPVERSRCKFGGDRTYFSPKKRLQFSRRCFSVFPGWKVSKKSPRNTPMSLKMSLTTSTKKTNPNRLRANSGTGRAVMAMFIGREVLDRIFSKEGYCKPFCYRMDGRAVRQRSRRMNRSLN